MNKKRIKSIGAAVVAMALMFGFTAQNASAYVEFGKEVTYVYDAGEADLHIPDAYQYKTSFYLSQVPDINVTKPVYMQITATGETYIVETELGVIICLEYKNNKMNFVRTAAEFILPDGTVTTLNKPEGIYVHSNGDFYIADTGNNRVLVTDTDLKVKMEIYMPTKQELGGIDISTFLPTSVVVDTAGRISVVARNINNGIMEFSKEGQFKSFKGAPAVQMDAFTRFLRKFQTDAQKAQSLSYVPTEYNNIRIDDNNFIWGTISAMSALDIMSNVYDASGKLTPIKKLNTMGSDILKRKGGRAPWGDVYYTTEPSRIIDVGIGPDGVYTLLDARLGRMFTFNDDGIMLYAFGNMGTRKGNTQLPVSIGYLGNNIVLLDSALREIIIFEPTTYGSLLLEAEGYYRDGKYEEAYNRWAQAAELNSNFKYAYLGLGNARYNEENYEEAMAYYQYAGKTANYSQAKDMLRKDQMQKVFPFAASAVVILAVCFVVVVVYKKLKKYALADDSFGYNRNTEED